MKTVLAVFGTRPEAIKMCPVVRALKTYGDMRTVVCVTGQHRQMLDQVLAAFSVVPDYDLSIMRRDQTLFDITQEVLSGIHGIIETVNPDIVLVHGDTTTSFAAALAAYYLNVNIGHVEAGLRTYDAFAPYPEEFNRVAVDEISRYCFAPTRLSAENLAKEGKSSDSIFVTGNTVIDALRTTVSKEYSHPDLNWATQDGSRLILVTAHRRENLGEPMHHMFRAIRRILDETPDARAIYPIHLNPAVRKVADEELSGCNRLRLIEPLDVLDFHNFMARSYLILTDSGGIQEEAPTFGVPVLVMRDVTERPEGIEAGTLKLVGTSEKMIYEACRDLLSNAGPNSNYQMMSRASNPYGDGHAAERIAEVLNRTSSNEAIDVVSQP